jgi:hypothetical protein
MQQLTVVVPATGAATGTFDAGGYEYIIVAADVLAGAEEVDIENLAGATFKTTTNESGTAQKLTASISSLRLTGGTVYRFSKDATVGSCGVYVQLGVPMRK